MEAIKCNVTGTACDGYRLTVTHIADYLQHAVDLMLGAISPKLKDCQISTFSSEWRHNGFTYAWLESAYFAASLCKLVYMYMQKCPRYCV